MILPPRRLAPAELVTARAYNALLDYCRRAMPLAGANVSVDYSLGGARISAAPRAASRGGARPWQVRWHSPGGEAVGQWEVYVPDGALSVGETCRALNRPASLAEGHGDDAEGWRALPLDEGGAGAGGGERAFAVVAHGKPRAMLQGVDEEGAAERAGVFVRADDLARRASMTAAERGEWGDAFSKIVALVHVEGSGEAASRRVVQIDDAPISVGTLRRAPFDLVWWFARLDDGGLKVEHVRCVRPAAGVAGAELAFPEEEGGTDLKGAKRVYLHIATQGGSNSGRVVADPSSARADEANAWAPIYSLDGDCVSSDFRDNLLAGIQYYR